MQISAINSTNPKIAFGELILDGPDNITYIYKKAEPNMKKDSITDTVMISKNALAPKSTNAAKQTNLFGFFKNIISKFKK